MIILDAELFAGLLFSALVLFFAVLWMVSVFKRPRGSAVDFGAVVRCPYCGHVFKQDRPKDIVNCPICNSFIEGREHA